MFNLTLFCQTQHSRLYSAKRTKFHKLSMPYCLKQTKTIWELKKKVWMLTTTPCNEHYLQNSMTHFEGPTLDCMLGVSLSKKIWFHTGYSWSSITGVRATSLLSTYMTTYGSDEPTMSLDSSSKASKSWMTTTRAPGVRCGRDGSRCLMATKTLQLILMSINYYNNILHTMYYYPLIILVVDYKTTK